MLKNIFKLCVSTLTLATFLGSPIYARSQDSKENTTCSDDTPTNKTQILKPDLTQNINTHNDTEQREEALKQIVQKINSNGVKMYGAYWCPYCTSQLNVFGDHKDEIVYVECGIPDKRGYISDECVMQGILAIPTWVSDSGIKARGSMTVNGIPLTLQN